MVAVLSCRWGCLDSGRPEQDDWWEERWRHGMVRFIFITAQAALHFCIFCLCGFIKNFDRKKKIPESFKTWNFNLPFAGYYLVDEESAYNAGDPRLILGLGISPGEGHESPLLYSCLENPMDWGAWRATVDGVTKSLTQLSTSAHICMAFALLSIISI